MGKPSETIFSGSDHVIAMPDVAFVELQFDNQRNPYGAVIVMKQTRWENESSGWANACYLPQAEYVKFISAYSTYRYEIDDVADPYPSDATDGQKVPRESSQVGT